MKMKRFSCFFIAFVLSFVLAFGACGGDSGYAKDLPIYFGVKYMNDFVVENEKDQRLENKYYRGSGFWPTITKSAAYKDYGMRGYFIEEYKIKCSELTYHAKSKNVYFGVWWDALEGKNISKAKYWCDGKSLERKFAVYGKTNRYKLDLWWGDKFFYFVDVKGRLLDHKKQVLFSEKRDKGLNIKNAAGKINLDIYGWKTESIDELRYKHFRKIIFPTKKTVTIRNVRIERKQKPKIKGAVVVPRKKYKKGVKKLKAKNLFNTSTIAVYFAPVEKATKYVVYRKEAGKKGFKKIKTLKGIYNTGFEDFKVEKGKKYKYKVKAFKGKKKRGKASNVVSVTKR
jgi:hypothetical protein